MITENVSTLKIHKLTQAQYDRELEAGRIDENALYLTPDDISVMTISSYDPDGVIASAGGIAAWITATYENAEVNSY